jgi:uncharacterized protein
MMFRVPMLKAEGLVGTIYAVGQGVPQDYAEAMKWYWKAAEQGLAVAQFSLGLMYPNGNGIPQDYVSAHMWLNLSAAHDKNTIVSVETHALSD